MVMVGPIKINGQRFDIVVIKCTLPRFKKNSQSVVSRYDMIVLMGTATLASFYSYSVRPVILVRRDFLRRFIQLERSMLIMRANGRQANSSIIDPVYIAPAASATFTAGRTDVSPA